MTCIVGYIDKDTVTIGGDSAGVTGIDVRNRRDPKIFENGEFVFGCTSSYRMIQLLRFSLKPPPINKEIYEYMCTDFIDAVRECFTRGGFMQKEAEGDDAGGEFLVARGGRLFKVYADYQVAEFNEKYAASGCGEDYALGALYVLDSISMDSRFKLTTSLEAAAKYSGGVTPPFIFITTKPTNNL